MKNNLLDIAADVLEKAAAYIDAVEEDKEASAHADQLKVAGDLKARLLEATGEELSDDVVLKLASAGEDVVALIEKFAGTNQAPESMGGPSGIRDGFEMPTNKKEAAAIAEERMLSWLTE